MTDNEKIISIATDAMKRAYAPYSHYQVGAALLCDDGSIYEGFNIENAAYSPTLCAERAAFARALVDGKRHFAAIAIAGGPNGVLIQSPAMPCGVCRQFMREFCTSDFKVLCAYSGGVIEKTLDELLPLGFGPENLSASDEQ